MRTSQWNDAVSVIDRVTLVLDCFGSDDTRLGVSEIARRSNLPKSTVSRLVAELVQHRYLERDGNGVRLGLRLFELGELAAQPNERRRHALTALAALRDATGHTVHLVVRDGDDVVCLGVLRGPRSPAPRLRAGGRVPALSTAAGRALFGKAQEDGFAYDHDDAGAHIVGVAGVIPAVGADPTGAVSVSGRPGHIDAAGVSAALRTALLQLGQTT